MNKRVQKNSTAAFTLIELLVVIAVIGILTGLVVGITGMADRKNKLARVTTEMEVIKTAIESYKGKRGQYPPDSPKDSQQNALYYELIGATSSPAEYVTLDGADTLPVGIFSVAGMLGGLGVSGIANSSAGLQRDDAGGAEAFLKNIRPAQVVTITKGGDAIKVLNVPVPGTDGSNTNPWHYNSHDPIHNTQSYDLWAEILIGKQSYIIGNWSDKPIAN